MRLVTFTHNGSTRVGALNTHDGRETVIDLTTADTRIPADMIAFIAGGKQTLALAQEAANKAGDGLDLSAVTLHAPIPRPGKILCLGLNYADHAAESGQEIPKYPVVFMKAITSVLDPGQPIVLPHVTNQVDWEAEFAFVIGKQGRYIPESEAMSYVFGYMPLNDVSARDYQLRVSQWIMGKSFDTFAPMGPALVTSDEIPDPHNLNIRLLLNGEVMQSSNTHNLIFNVPRLVNLLSEVMTLESGDVVSTGTPGGVGGARKPPRFLKAGETVEVEIEHLGVLRNPVAAEKDKGRKLEG